MNIALRGFGTVGKAFYELTLGRSDLRVTSVLSRRPRPELPCTVTNDFDEIVRDRSVGIVVEVMGGTGAGLPLYLRGHARGQARRHREQAARVRALRRAAGACEGVRRVAALHGGGGRRHPVAHVLSRAARLDEITAVGGILNGTTNYMLSAMTASGVDYTTCLREAQALGYAEADPTADVEGYDARRKLVLSANLAFGASVREEDIPCFGISSVEKKDFAAWRELGRVCKLFVRAERHEGRISAFVCPTLFPAASPVAQTNGTGNLVTLRGARFGELSFSGAGAGGYPTGSSVLSDCVDVIEGCPSFYVSRHEAKHIDNSAAVGRFYLRTGSETVCTGPITVAEAFARAERARSCGEPVFLARIEEE